MKTPLFEGQIIYEAYGKGKSKYQLALFRFKAYIHKLLILRKRKRDRDMARVCDLTGKRRLVGNKVSHAHNKTKMTHQPNLKMKKIFDPETGQTVRLRLSTRAIRTLDKVGSLSKFLRKNRHLFC